MPGGKDETLLEKAKSKGLLVVAALALFKICTLFIPVTAAAIGTTAFAAKNLISSEEK